MDGCVYYGDDAGEEEECVLEKDQKTYTDPGSKEWIHKLLKLIKNEAIA